ncbi:energy-coupling factor ABC transporter substrate-binding protein [Eubacteriales bacterium KG127]
MMNKKGNSKLAVILIIICVLLAIVPLFALKDAEFGGSDDAGSGAISEIVKENKGITDKDYEYEPWATPILEKLLGGELPGEVESLIFCVQTGIGVGIVAFLLGRLTQRHKDREKYGIPQDADE